MAFLIVFNCGPLVFKEHNEFIKKLEALREAAEALAAKNGPVDAQSINDYTSQVSKNTHLTHRSARSARSNLSSSSAYRPGVAKLVSATNKTLKMAHLEKKKQQSILMQR